MVTTKVYMYLLNVLATTDDFMSVDRKALKTAVWEALEGTIFYCYMIACAQCSQAACQQKSIRSIVVVEESSIIRPYHS